MISLRRIRAIGVLSALFGASAAIVSTTVNLGVWLTAQPQHYWRSTFFWIFSSVPFAFMIGCAIGVAFSAVMFVRRARSERALRTRWLISAGFLGGATVGLAGAFYPQAPRDLQSAVDGAWASVGVFSLIGAGTAGLFARIARGRGALPTRGLQVAQRQQHIACDSTVSAVRDNGVCERSRWHSDGIRNGLSSQRICDD